MMHPDVDRILISREEIEERSKVLGKEISEYYEGKNPIVVGLLKGSVPFMAELVKNITCDMEMDFMDVSSYSGTESTEVRIVKDLDALVKDRYILMVEDIVDTGKTLKKVVEFLYAKGAKEIKIACLLDKPEGRKVQIETDWSGFFIPNAFVIGFGLDYNQKYRNLPYVGVIKESAI